MSLVPLRFRDWWDDFDRPLSRLPDQHFGRGWFRDDLVSRLADWSLREPRSPLLDTYYRPWRSVLGRDGGSSTIRADKDRFQVGVRGRGRLGSLERGRPRRPPCGARGACIGVFFSRPWLCPPRNSFRITSGWAKVGVVVSTLENPL